MELSISPLFFLWLMAVLAFVWAYRAGRRREKAARQHDWRNERTLP